MVLETRCLKDPHRCDYHLWPNLIKECPGYDRHLGTSWKEFQEIQDWKQQTGQVHSYSIPSSNSLHFTFIPPLFNIQCWFSRSVLFFVSSFSSCHFYMSSPHSFILSFLNSPFIGFRKEHRLAWFEESLFLSLLSTSVILGFLIVFLYLSSQNCFFPLPSYVHIFPSTFSLLPKESNVLVHIVWLVLLYFRKWHDWCLSDYFLFDYSCAFIVSLLFDNDCFL